MTTISAELAVYGDDLNPEQFTSVLGVQPTKTWLRGDIRNRRTNAVFDYGCWKTCTDESNSSLEEHLRALYQRFADKADLISEFADEHGCEIELSVIVKIVEESPDISLSKDAVDWLCGLGARLDFDIYL